MKKTIITLFVLVSCTCAVSAGKLSALFSYNTFNNPSGKPYVETYLNVDGSSVETRQTASGKYVGTIEVQLILKKSNETIYLDKYLLNSPESAKKQLLNNFIDAQRIPVENGVYKLFVSIADKNSAAAPYEHTEDILIDFQPDKICISDIELLESFNKSSENTRFSKSGYELIPFASNFIPPSVNSLRFYAEVYNTSSVLENESDFLIRYFIEDFESKRPNGNLGGIIKSKAKHVNVLLSELFIENLQSGNYNLWVEIVSKENKVLASKKLFFQRAKQILIPIAMEDLSSIKIENSFVENITNVDTLTDFINCLYPISTNNEANSAKVQVKLKEVKSMQQYFLFFWSLRNRQDPEGEWIEYKKMVNAVNNSYSTFNKKGYESSRGRVYLQYGPPNTISENYNEPGEFPYEIWHYYKLENQTNKKFVFMNKNRASNEFALIHSDATGEINEPRWELLLSDNQNNYGMDWDQKKTPDHYGKRSNEQFNLPK